MRVQSRHSAYGLLAIAMVNVAWQFALLGAVRQSTREAIWPGEPWPARWRLVGMELLGASLACGALALSRISRHDDRGYILACLAGLVGAVGVIAGSHTWGPIALESFPILLSIVAALGLFGILLRRRQPGADEHDIDPSAAAVWLAALLQMLALLFVTILILEPHWDAAPARAAIMSLPQWFVAWRFTSAVRISRWDAGLTTMFGVIGIIEMALATIMPIGYYGMLGAYLLRSPVGMLFYATLGVGSWLFLRAGLVARQRLRPPPSDRRWAIAAAFVAIPVIVIAGHFIGAMLPQ